MSDVDVLPPSSPIRPNEDEDEPQQAMDEGTEDAGEVDVVKNDEEMLEAEPIEQAEPEEEKSVQAAEEEKQGEDDRTEDQVPDITGTENVDPMTTSMDGIEELPASEETQNVETAEGEPKEKQEKQTVEAEAKMEVAAEGSEQAEQKKNEVTAGAASDAEETLQQSGVQEELPVEGDFVVSNEKEHVEEQQMVEAEVEPEAEAEKAAEEVREKSQAQELAANEAVEQPTEEGGFELKAPPTPKRPRTPNELDNVEPTEAVEETAEPLSNDMIEVELKQVATPPTEKAETPSTPKTPKSRKTSSAATPAVTNGSIPQTPQSATTEEQPATPRSGTVALRGEFIEEKPAEQEEHPKMESAEQQLTTAEEEPVAEPEPEALLEPEAEAEPESVPKPGPELELKPESAPEAVAEPEPTEEKEPGPTDTSAPEVADEAETEPVAEKKVVGEEAGEQKLDEVEVTAAEEPQVESTDQQEVHISEAKVEMEESTPPAPKRVASPSPPPRRRQERSPSPVRRQQNSTSTREYIHYDQDSHRIKGAPPRLPTYTSFSSYTPVEKSTYSPISPWVQNAPHKYRNEYTAASSYRPPSTYLSHFDDIVSTGPFAASLYATSRLLERSRSRTRERRNAMRSQRSASNYYRYTSAYGAAPIRTRDYSTPPLSAVSRPPSRSGSFISFMEYSDAKQYELARNRSRSAILDGPLSRPNSHSEVDLYYKSGRLSRVDSYIRDMNHQYEWEVPSSYAKYRSSSRSYLPQDYTPINGYTSYNNTSYIDTDSTQRMKRYAHDAAANVRSMYESRIGELERSLSRERLARDRMKTKYTELSSKLEQACKQMDLLRTNSYSSIRGGTARFSVYSHFYPYY